MTREMRGLHNGFKEVEGSNSIFSVMQLLEFITIIV